MNIAICLKPSFPNQSLKACYKYGRSYGCSEGSMLSVDFQLWGVVIGPSVLHWLYSGHFIYLFPLLGWDIHRTGAMKGNKTEESGKPLTIAVVSY